MSNVIKLDLEQIQKLALFESITRTSLKDFLEDENELTFIVNMKNLGKAIGKGANNIRILENKFQKRVLLLGYDSDYKIFAKNIFKPIIIKNIKLENDSLIITIFGSQMAFPSKKVKKAKILLTKYFDNIKRIMVKV
jgi:NusA-like KH domain protein